MKEIINPILRCPKLAGIQPVYDKNCELLMLGSITATDGINKGFYYASNKNLTVKDYCEKNNINKSQF